VSILSRVNRPGAPNAIEQLEALEARERDPQTCTLHELSIVLPKLSPSRLATIEELELGDVAERKKLVEKRKRAIDACDDDERAADLRNQYQREDDAAKGRIAWDTSATGRLLSYLDCSPHDVGPRVEWWCPSCQRAAVDARATVTDDELPDERPLVIEHRYGQPLGPIVRVACLAGCTTEQLATAMRSFVVEYEAREARETADEQLEALRAEFTPSAPRPVEWSGLVPARGLTLINAVSGSFKSWLLEAIAVSVASGRPLVERDTPRGVVLLALLESYDINMSRVEPLARGLGTSYADELRGKWLHVWPRTMPLKTDDATSLAKLGEFVRVFQPSMILIDNLTEIRAGTSQNSENDSTIMSNALRPLAQLAHDGVINGQRVTANPPAVVVLHHDRGSSAIEQHADLVIELTAKGQDAESPVTLRVGQGSRVRPPSLPLTMRFRGTLPAPIVPELVVPRERKASDETALPATVQKVLDVLSADEGMSITAIAAESKCSKRDIPERLGKLRDLGRAVERDGLWYAVEPAE
jgi:hypothetical protein